MGIQVGRPFFGSASSSSSSAGSTRPVPRDGSREAERAAWHPGSRTGPPSGSWRALVQRLADASRRASAVLIRSRAEQPLLGVPLCRRRPRLFSLRERVQAHVILIVLVTLAIVVSLWPILLVLSVVLLLILSRF